MKKVKTYTITLKITDHGTFTVAADDFEDAVEIAQRRYIEDLKMMLPRYDFDEIEVDGYDIDYDEISY